MPAPSVPQEWRSAPAEDAGKWRARGWAVHSFTQSRRPPDGMTPAVTGAAHPLRDVVILRRPLVLRDEGEAA